MSLNVGICIIAGATITSIFWFLNLILFNTELVNRSTNIISPLDFQLPPTKGFLLFLMISSSLSIVKSPSGSSHFSAYFPLLNSNLKFLTLSRSPLSMLGTETGILTGDGAIVILDFTSLISSSILLIYSRTVEGYFDRNALICSRPSSGPLLDCLLITSSKWLLTMSIAKVSSVLYFKTYLIEKLSWSSRTSLLDIDLNLLSIYL